MNPDLFPEDKNKNLKMNMKASFKKDVDHTKENEEVSDPSTKEQKKNVKC